MRIEDLISMTESNATLIAIGVSLLTSALVWIMADTRLKAKIIFLEGELTKFQLSSSESIERLISAKGNLSISIAKSEQDRSEIHRQLDRLDDNKASKDVVENFKSEMATLRADMEKRFDRLERLLENKNNA